MSSNRGIGFSMIKTQVSQGTASRYMNITMYMYLIIADLADEVGRNDEFCVSTLIPFGFQAEDEEGYRNLIDQKKDKRLAYLLSQTDEYISSLTLMVQQHKKEQMKKRRHKGQRRKSDFEDEVEEGSQRIPVYDTETGHVLKGEDGPTADQLEEWLASHPGSVHVNCM